MVLAKLRDTGMQPVERQAVRWQRQRIGRQRFEHRQRIEIVAHRIGVGLCRRHDHRRRDVGENLIARDQDLVGFAIEDDACSGE